MCKIGATITEDHVGDTNNDDDILHVNNTDDLYATQEVLIFDNGSNNVNEVVTIIAVDHIQKQITVPDINTTISKWSGIRLNVTNPDAYDTSDQFIDLSFGDISCGMFVEFVNAPLGSGFVPKYKLFENLAQVNQYSLFWFKHHEDNILNKNNVFHWIPAFDHNVPNTPDNPYINISNAWSVAGLNLNILFHSRFDTGANSPDVVEKKKARTLIHEFGHQFDIMNNHVDEPLPDHPNPSEICNNSINNCHTYKCVMSYCSSRGELANGVGFGKNEPGYSDQKCFYAIRHSLEPR